MLGPLIDLYARRQVIGREHLAAARGLRSCSWPTTRATWTPRSSSGRCRGRGAGARRSRRRPTTSTASPGSRTWSRWRSTRFPSSAREKAAVPDAASLLAQLLDDGWSLLVFAEGTRSRDGTVGRLRSGAAVLAAEHGLAIVPVHVSGTHAVMPPGRRWMRRARGTFTGARQPIAVRFGAPVRPQDGEHRTEVMERVRLFFDASGAVTTPDPRIAARRSASPPSAT